MKRRLVALALATVVGAAALAGCGGGGGGSTTAAASGGGGGGKTQILTFGTADSTGTLYPVGAAIASVINDNVPGYKVNVETSKGSPANCTNIQNGEIDLGLATGDVARDAVEGKGTFEGAACPDIRCIAATFPSVSGWMALRSSGFTMVHDLDGKNLSIGPEASATETAALAAIKACGITPAETTNLGIGDASEEVGDGMRDANHAFAGQPIGGQLSVAQTKDCVFLGYTEDELKTICTDNPSYYPTVIPAGTYPGQDEDVPTFGVKCLIIVRADMDEEQVYKFTEAIATHTQDLANAHQALTAMADPDFFCNELPIELHPGAKKYYEEKGMLK